MEVTYHLSVDLISPAKEELTEQPSGDQENSAEEKAENKEESQEEKGELTLYV